jgi:hypothetical protein
MERFNCTLKTRICVYFSDHDTKQYENVLQYMVCAYNHSVGRTLGMRLPDVVAEQAANGAQITLYYNDSRGRSQETPLDECERMRISRW